MTATYDKSMLPDGIEIDENLLPYKKNRTLNYGWGRKFNAFVSQSGGCYHRGHCKMLNGHKKKLIHLYEGIERYQPCAVCNPQKNIDEWYSFFLSENSIDKNCPSLPFPPEIISPHPLLEETDKTDNIHIIKIYKSVIAVLALALAIIAICFIFSKINATKALADKDAEYTSLVQSIQEELADVNSKNETLSSEIFDLKALESSSQTWKKKADILDNYIVFVTTTGKCYHRLDCQYLNGAQSFMAFNINYAKHLNYEPCSVCVPPYSN